MGPSSPFQAEIGRLRALIQLLTGGSAPSTGGGWITAFDLDFTTQPSQTLAPDGAYVIAGKTWMKAGSATERAPLAIVPGPGNGLIFQPAGGGGSPSLSLLLSSVLPAAALKWSTSLRLWSLVSQQNFTAQPDGEAATSFSPPTSGYLTQYSQPAGDAQQSLEVILASGSAGKVRTLSVAASTANNVTVLEVPGLDSGQARWLFGGSTDNSWPTDLDIAPALAVATTSVWPNESPALLLANRTLVLRGLSLLGGPSLATIGFGRVRLDFKN